MQSQTWPRNRVATYSVKGSLFALNCEHCILMNVMTQHHVVGLGLRLLEHSHACELRRPWHDLLLIHLGLFGVSFGANSRHFLHVG